MSNKFVFRMAGLGLCTLAAASFATSTGTAQSGTDTSGDGGIKALDAAAVVNVCLVQDRAVSYPVKLCNTSGCADCSSGTTEEIRSLKWSMSSVPMVCHDTGDAGGWTETARNLDEAPGLSEIHSPMKGIPNLYIFVGNRDGDPEAVYYSNQPAFERCLATNPQG